MTATARVPHDPLASPSATPAAESRASARLDIIDRLRGLVIVLMVLDHVREFWAADALRFEATDLARTTPLLFATRWVTHLCAPTFVFLAGAAIYLQRVQATDRARLARFLLTRGIWLIVLELTLVSFALDLTWPYLFFQVIWAIGIGMVLLAALLWIPPAAVLALGAVIVAGHGLLAGVQAQQLGVLAPLWRLFVQLGPTPPVPGFVAYPALPWFGVMCLGYGLGVVFTWPADRMRRALLTLGGAGVAAFLLLRAVNRFGDPAPWSTQRDGVFTALSFVKVSKYPPSLQFVLATLGLSLPIGVALERLRGPVGRLLLAFGRVPLFVYLLHLYAVHLLAVVVGVAMGLPAPAFIGYLTDQATLRATGWGFGLGVVYVVWLALVVAMYPLAARYARLKRERPRWWMRYV